MRSFSLFFIGVAIAEETCSDGTCSQDEATLLQMHGLRQKGQEAEALTQQPDADGVLNRDTQCWHANQCAGQGGECPSGYCGDGGVCCRAGAVYSDHERLVCGENGYGIVGMHTCQPRILNEGQQCWHTGQCDQQGGRCQNYCGARGVCCRAGAVYSDQEREECGENGHGNPGMHQCHLPPWNQWEADLSKCNRNENLVCVDSQAECQAEAEANGHIWYSFRHNSPTRGRCNGRYRCFSSAHCDDALIGNRRNDWKIYTSR